MNKYRTHLIKDITDALIDENIVVSGWVENIRDHGGVLFLDLRDETGTLQTVSNDDDMFKGIKKESVVRLKGKLRKRDEGTENGRITTGTVELLVDTLDILGDCTQDLPFDIMTSKHTKDDVRLKYRYLDMRNEQVKANIQLRAEILHFLRDKMYNLGFTEVQTPILTASSPEGARDFVVPSRLFKGKFYALPQAPQIYKELLMVGGLGKYFQIAPCFRDEDARADRTLEFYQLDLEMSFVEEDEVLAVGEEIFYDTFTKFSQKEVTKPPFRRIAYRDAMEIYGTDKPDLRNPLLIQDATEVLKDTTFNPFKNATIKVIVADEIGSNSNSWFNELVDYASSIGMPGIGYVTLLEDGSLKGPIDKFLSDEERKNLIAKFNMKTNSVMFFIANKHLKTAQKFAGLIRDELGHKLDLIDKNKFEFCIVNDFPMYEWNEEEDKYDFTHNPFSMPKDGMEAFKKEPHEIVAHQFDFVCNGVEMASGAVRNHDLEIMKKAFKIAGYEEEELERRFKALYTAFQYGAPPHAGMAPGLDRMIMMLLDEENIRQTIAFPMAASGQDFLMQSPSDATETQLRELHIKIRDHN